MTNESETHRDLAEIRNKVGELEGTVRVIKHGLANVQMAQSGIGLRLDKFEEKIGDKIDGLSDKVSAINATQSRGLGFFAGISFMITLPLGVLLAFAKMLFGGHTG